MTNRHKRIVSICSTLIACFFLLNCNSKKEELPISSEGIKTPSQEFTESTLNFFNNGYIQWKLSAKYMRKPLSDTGSILVTPVRLTLYDSLGIIRSRVLADSGTISTEMNSYIVWGNVYIRTRDSMIVQTEWLKWFKERHRVESNTFVQIETKRGDLLRGKGLDATEDFSHFSFKSNVSGKFPNFEKRLETQDESVF